MKKISTEKAPAAVGPYSQAMMYGDILFTSGQIGLDPATGAFAGDDVVTQAKQVCENLKAVLAAADMTFENVIKTTCFLAEIADFAAFNAVYADYFVSMPARSCVAAKDLPKGALCEIEVIAAK
ncbi:MAG: regulator [Clostridia bacterium]|nr:regulator [Clostridia bacterium]MBP3554661.1 regulator [Clostridia bacterium]